MAIAFNLPGIPSQIRGTAEEAGAVPDLGQAMMQGFRSNIENVQGYPRQLAQQLLSNQLANKIRGVEAQYAEPMAKTKYDQALANLQHQGLINKYYPQLMQSQLTTAGLSQAHQRMANERAQMDLNIYKDAYKAFKNQGATHEQAHQAAVDAVQQQSATREPVVPEVTQMLTGKAMPEYLSNLVRQQPQTQQTMPQQMLPMTGEGYSPMQENLFGPQYSQKPFEMELQKAPSMAMELTPTLKAGEMPEYLQRPMEMELSSSLPVEMSAQQQVPQEQMQPQSYVEQLQQQGYNTDNFNPQNAGADELYLKSPLHRAIIEKMAPGTGIKRYNDFPRNRQIVTTTLPSGATKTTIESLGGTQGAADSYKAQSPIGKARADLRHDMEIGDLEGANQDKKYIDNLLNKDQKSQTTFDKSYKEWEESVKEFGADSQKAKDFRARVDSLIRGSVIRQEPAPPKGATPVYDTNNNYIGYNQPLSKDQIEARVAPVGFNALYPYISEGVKPYQGTVAEVNAQIKNDLKNQNTDPAAQDRLYKLILAKNLLTSGAARESKMIDAPKVKNIFASLKEALGGTDLPFETFFKEKGFTFYEKQINRAIKNRAQDDFGIISNMAANNIQKARDKASREREFVPAREFMDLGTRISKGAKKAKTKTQPIKMMPNAKGELEIVNG
jgi:hypothetical protein